MKWWYNFFFGLFFWLSAPYYFLRLWRRGNWRRGFSQRFGRFDSKVKQAVSNRHVLWFHAVSVGEVNLCTQLIRALEPRAPNLKIVVSTTTTTGMGELQKKLPSHILKIFYPIDFRKPVMRAIAAIHPKAVVLVEAEIWPNFIWRLRERRIPAMLVNARLSRRSYRGYRRFAWLFRPLFASFAAVGAQNQEDVRRLAALGCRPEALRVVGNLKFDAAQLGERPLLDISALLERVGVTPDRPILLGGSTHPGEEAILADLFLRLRKRFPKLFLVLVPRHFERGREVGRSLESKQISFVYRTDVTPQTRFNPGRFDALLVNTTGELRYFYEFATVIFVGKSLAAEGGQNPIEPAALGKPIVFGPHMENFASIASAFVAGDAALQINDEQDLEKAIEGLLRDPAARDRLGKNAREVVRQNLGAVERTVEMIVQNLPKEIVT